MNPIRWFVHGLLFSDQGYEVAKDVLYDHRSDFGNIEDEIPLLQRENIHWLPLRVVAMFADLRYIENRRITDPERIAHQKASLSAQGFTEPLTIV